MTDVEDHAIPMQYRELSWTEIHGCNVAKLCVEIGMEMGMRPRQVTRLRLAGALHDLGKTLIPETILNTPRPLTSDEWVMMHLHPALGEQMLVAKGALDIAPWVRAHHERFDGHGYPDGRRGGEIPFEARILAVADAYDAMTSERPYSEAMLLEQAREELAAGAGSQFDPQVVAAFACCLGRAQIAIPAAVAA